MIDWGRELEGEKAGKEGERSGWIELRRGGEKDGWGCAIFWSRGKEEEEDERRKGRRKGK